MHGDAVAGVQGGVALDQTEVSPGAVRGRGHRVMMFFFFRRRRRRRRSRRQMEKRKVLIENYLVLLISYSNAAFNKINSFR